MGQGILYCSFCGKSQHEVRKLIASRSAYICDECIELGVDILVAEKVPLRLESPLHVMGDESKFEQLEKIEFASLPELLREGGLEKTEGPFNASEIVKAVSTAILGRFNLKPVIEEEAKPSG